MDDGVSPFFLSWARLVLGAVLLILAGSWLATDDRLPPNPTAIVTRWRGSREPAVAEPSAPFRAV